MDVTERSMHINPNLIGHFNNANSAVQTSMERLSTGFNINSARDDAAGLEIANRLKTGSHGLDVAVRNLNDAISMAQTAEGAITEITNILQRMRDLSAQQSANSEERVALQEEITALKEELNRIAETTSFGGRRLLNGTFETQSFQIGANGEKVDVPLQDMRPSNAKMALDTIDVTSVTRAQDAVASIDAALNYVNSYRAELAECQSRCEHAIRNQNNIYENVNVSDSRIRDTDFAHESTQMTKSQILSQAESTVLAQAHQAPNAALSLLR